MNYDFSLCRLQKHLPSIRWPVKVNIAGAVSYWVKLPQKAEQFKVFTDKDQVLRIEFADRPYALEVP